MYEYAKVLLYAYPRLIAFAEAAEQSATNRAALSYRAKLGAEEDAAGVVKELDAGRRLRALKAMLGEMLDGFSCEERALLAYRYFRTGKGTLQLACSPRSYYRKQEALVRCVAVYLAVKGITERTFLQQFGDLPGFSRVYQALKAGRESAVVKKRERARIRFQKRSELSCEEGLGERFPRTTRTAMAMAPAERTQRAAMAAGESAPSGLGGTGCSVEGR